MFQLIIEGETFEDIMVNLREEFYRYNNKNQEVVEQVVVEVCPPGEVVYSTPPVSTLDAATRPDDEDVNGIKWDKRIHASSKAKMKDGTWRKRRGVDSAKVKEVEGEQNKVEEVAIPQVPLVAPAPLPDKIDASPTAVMSPPIPVFTAGGHTLETFQANLVVVIADLIEKGKITHKYVRQLCDFFEVAELYEIFNDKDKASQLFEEFVKNGLLVKVS